MKNAFLVLIFAFFLHAENVYGQCSVLSSTGYTVTASISAISVNAQTPCPNGYSYTVSVQYNVVISGPNAPGSLYTLQGYLQCGSTSLYFNMPNSGGTGVATTSNNWTSMTNCTSATPASLSCYTVNVQIHGPGVNTTINCPLGSGLPIELINFKAHQKEDKTVELAWQTAAEINNDFFEIERSKDGLDWQSLARIIGAGNSSSLLSYVYHDEMPLREKVVYYRLKQHDFDGNYSYSPIESVSNIITVDTDLVIYPNPSKDLITVEGNSEELMEMEIFSIDNKLVKKHTSNGTSETSVRIDLRDLPAGTYLLRTRSNNKRIIKL